MLLAAEFGTGQVVWSLLYIFLVFVWIMLIFTIFGDLIRNDAMSGWAKAFWTVFIIFVPFLGILVYLIVYGSSMTERQVKAAQQQEAQVQDYIRTTAGAPSQADELAKLAELHKAGSLDDAEYAAAKAKILN